MACGAVAKLLSVPVVPLGKVHWGLCVAAPFSVAISMNCSVANRFHDKHDYRYCVPYPLLQELSSLQGQLDRAFLDRAKAERAKQHMVDRSSWDRTLPRFVNSRPGTAGAATGGGDGGGWISPDFTERGESRVGYMRGGTSADVEGAAAGTCVGEGEEGGGRRGVTVQGLFSGSKEGTGVQQEQQQSQQRLVVDDTLQQHDKSQQTAVAVA